MTQSEIQDLRQFVRDRRPTTAGAFERKLWDVAERAPLGCNLIGTEEDPYLLRVYVSPRAPQFARLWGKCRSRLRSLGEFDSAWVEGVPHVYLHHFFRGDSDRELHNHPWVSSVSLILTNGYIEERWDPGERRMRYRHVYPGDFNVIRATDFHRVILRNPVRGCWTLFFTHRRIEEKNGHDWGFLDVTTGVYTPWGPFLRARRERMDHLHG